MKLLQLPADGGNPGYRARPSLGEGESNELSETSQWNPAGASPARSTP